MQTVFTKLNESCLIKIGDLVDQRIRYNYSPMKEVIDDETLTRFKTIWDTLIKTVWLTDNDVKDFHKKLEGKTMYHIQDLALINSTEKKYYYGEYVPNVRFGTSLISGRGILIDFDNGLIQVGIFDQ